MNWAAPRLRRFEFSFPACLPDVPTADPPPVESPPHADVLQSSHSSLDVVCYGASSDELLSLTRSSHPLFGSHCYTGLQTYSGAEVLARLMLRRPRIVQQSRAVLEIGCGIGLTGVVAAHCMNQQWQQSLTSAHAHPPLLVLTDGEEDAVRLTRCNLHLHLTRPTQQQQQQQASEAAALQFLTSPIASSAQLTPPPPSTTADAALSLHALSARWDDSGVAAISSYCESALGRPARFDVVYGTDLFYARTAADDILHFATPLLSDAGIIILVHTPRVPELHASLRAACKRHSLTVRYLNPSSFIGRAEEVERGWTQVEVAVIAAEKAWDALLRSDDWHWAEFENEGRVERQLAEHERDEADDNRALSGLDVSADDL